MDINSCFAEVDQKNSKLFFYFLGLSFVLFFKGKLLLSFCLKCISINCSIVNKAMAKPVKGIAENTQINGIPDGLEPLCKPITIANVIPSFRNIYEKISANIRMIYLIKILLRKFKGSISILKCSCLLYVTAPPVNTDQIKAIIAISWPHKIEGIELIFLTNTSKATTKTNIIKKTVAIDNNVLSKKQLKFLNNFIKMIVHLP